MYNIVSTIIYIVFTKIGIGFLTMDLGVNLLSLVLTHPLCDFSLKISMSEDNKPTTLRDNRLGLHQ